MKTLIFLLSLVLMSFFPVGVTWKTVTSYIENTAVRFQMPAVPKEEVQGQLHSWKAEDGANTYWVVIQKRNCSSASDTINICDVMHPLIQYIVPHDWNVVESKDLHNNRKYILFTDSIGSFIHISLHYNNDFVLLLATKTADKDSPTHKRFIESFVFLE